ncbi:hypothetical protein E0K89_002780 [Aquicoccus sp. SCR17]|nr:hypothetical protein [Carideicomes alvinocaridis]
MPARILAKALLCLLLAAPALHAQPEERQPAAPAKQLIERRISLSEIGFDRGLEFDRLSGRRVLYFPLAPAEAMGRASLHLALRYGETLRTARALTVRIGDRTERAVDLDGTGSEEIAIELPAEALTGPFLKVELIYSGANSEQVCIDERASGDFLRVLPRSALVMGLDSDGLTSPLTVERLLPGRVSLLLPGEELAPPALAFALRAAARYDAEAGGLALHDTLPRRSAALWDRGVLAYERGSDEAPDLRVKPYRGLPGLRFSGDNPQAALSLLASPYRDLARATQLDAPRLAPPAETPDTLTFAALGAPDLSARVTGAATLEFSFPIDAFPVGRAPGGLDLLVGATPSPAGGGVSVTVYLNDTFLGARPLPTGDPTWMRFDVPEGLLGRSNALRVLVQRPTEGGDCRFAPQGYPVTILPQSRFTLDRETGEPEDFFALRQAAGQGLSVVLDGIDRATLEGWVLPVAGALLPEDAPVVVEDALSTGDAAGDGPFLYLSRNAPPESDPLLRLDQGRVEIRDRSGRTLFDGAGLARLGAAQIVEIGGRRGVWLRPGDGPAPRLTRATPLALDRGDLALIDEAGVAVAVSTLRTDLVEVRYPDRTDLWQILARYRLWIVAAGWVLLTLVVLRALQGFYRRSRGRGEGS